MSDSEDDVNEPLAMSLLANEEENDEPAVKNEFAEFNFRPLNTNLSDFSGGVKMETESAQNVKYDIMKQIEELVRVRSGKPKVHDMYASDEEDEDIIVDSLGGIVSRSLPIGMNSFDLNNHIAPTPAIIPAYNPVARRVARRMARRVAKRKRSNLSE